MDNNWIITFHPDFGPEFDGLPVDAQQELLAVMAVLADSGPGVGRPYVDTLKGSRHSNMKEARFQIDNHYWRFAFAFDPLRRGVILIGGDKSKMSETRFYNRLIQKADTRFDQWLATSRRGASFERKH